MPYDSDCDSVYSNQIFSALLLRPPASSRQKEAIFSISGKKVNLIWWRARARALWRRLHVCTRAHTTRTNKRGVLCLSFLTHPPALSLSLEFRPAGEIQTRQREWRLPNNKKGERRSCLYSKKREREKWKEAENIPPAGQYAPICVVVVVVFLSLNISLGW